MRREFKPYSKRRPFKRKQGGSKFMLGSGKSKFEFPSNLRSKKLSESMAGLIGLILGHRKVRSNVRTSNK